ncbi:MAG: hypothetical protein IKR40_07565 [Treponema sp.]|nr:hypothetical protein [Treponema sp.]
MKKQILISTLALASLLPLAADGGIEFSSTLETQWGIGAPWTDSEDCAGRFSLGSTSLTGKLDAYYGNSSAFAELTFSHDALDGDFFSDGLSISLGELWIDYTDSFWGVRVGRQKAAWGKADGIDITNVLCPSDMSSFSSMTSDDGKLAVDAIRLSLNGNSFTADAWWIPFFTPASLPLNEGNSLRKFVVPQNVEYPVPSLGTTLNLPVTIGNLEKPELALWNGEYGLKLSGYFSAFDVSLYGFYGWDDIPLLDYAMVGTWPAISGINVSGEYKRMGMIGADAALPLGEIVLRLETAFFPMRHFQKSAESIIGEKMLSGDPSTSEKHNQLSALAGVDWMPSGWTLTAQYYCDVVFGDIDSLERSDSYEHGATLSVSKSLVNETLELSLAGIIGLNDFDSMISPSVKYSLSDQITLSGGAYIFLPGPSRDGKYGAYKDLSTIYLDAKFSF